MRLRETNCLVARGRWLSVVGLIAVLMTAGQGRAQQSFFFFDWFGALQSSWVEQYQEDNETDDIRLAELPDMFGDSFARGGDLVINQDVLIGNTTSVLLAGGSRGLKPSEHNKAIPDNRVYFVYNHFHNAVSTRIDEPVGAIARQEQSSIDRYLLGLESRFGNGMWSIELRMPFTGQHDFSFTGVRTAENHSGDIGNLSVLLKRLVYYDPRTSVVVGLGIETPTGSDFLARTESISFRVANDAVHLVPYFGILHAHDDRWFLHGFVEVDVAANGNQITFIDMTGLNNGGKYTDQTLLYVDLSLGRWLHRDEDASLLTGIAALAEFHYTTTLQNTDVIVGAPMPTPSAFAAGNLANRMDVVNVTAAVHFEIAGNASLRVGGVFPITIDNDRFFDAEISAQFVRRF